MGRLLPQNFYNKKGKMKSNIFLSIVIPVKNEEKNIARCLSAVIDNIQKIQRSEVVVVDACSEDITLEQVLKFSVNIIQLKPFWVHTASAGRYLGCLNTKGKYLFFIDADTVLEPGFLVKALEFMEKNPDSGGVGGLGKEVYLEAGKQVGQIQNVHQRDSQKIAEVDYLGAAALFRRRALKDVGYFNPYLYSQEELDVCQRLKRNGWRVQSLPYPMTTHYTYPPKGVEIFKKQMRARRFTGIGQILRLALTNGMFWVNLWRFRKFFFFLILVLTMILVAAGFLFSGNKKILIVECGMLFSVYFYLVFKKQSFKKAMVSSIKWMMVISSVGKGFLECPKNPKDYPREVLIIREVN